MLGHMLDEGGLALFLNKSGIEERPVRDMYNG